MKLSDLLEFALPIAVWLIWGVSTFLKAKNKKKDTQKQPKRTRTETINESAEDIPQFPNYETSDMTEDKTENIPPYMMSEKLGTDETKAATSVSEEIATATESRNIHSFRSETNKRHKVSSEDNSVFNRKTKSETGADRSQNTVLSMQKLGQKRNTIIEHPILRIGIYVLFQ